MRDPSLGSKPRRALGCQFYEMLVKDDVKNRLVDLASVQRTGSTLLNSASTSSNGLEERRCLLADQVLVIVDRRNVKRVLEPCQFNPG